MPDLPYVCRAAISLELLGSPFEYAAVSIFRHFDQFSVISPMIKAPTLVYDNSAVLADSTFVIDYVETLAGCSLIFIVATECQHVLRVIGLALVACEKAVQVIYEYNLRPGGKAREPWVGHVHNQLLATMETLGAEWRDAPLPVEENELTQTGVTVTMAWASIQSMVVDCVPVTDHPCLVAYSVAAEQPSAFRELPVDAV